MGGIWKSLVLCSRKTLKCCKQRLRGLSGGSLGNQNAKKNVHTEGQDLETEEGKKTLTGMS